MTRLALVAALCVLATRASAVVSATGQSLEPLAVRAETGFEAAAAGKGMPAQTLPFQRFQRTARNPVGTITGAMNHSAIELTFDRRAGTILGAANNSAVEIAIDSDKDSITGGANHSKVELEFSWSPQRYLVKGGANRSVIRLEVDWAAGVLEGESNQSLVHVDFNLETGSMKGYANAATVDVQYDKATGRMTGAMNHSTVDITLVNLDLSDFLRHFFLFLKPRH